MQVYACSNNSLYRSASLNLACRLHGLNCFLGLYYSSADKEYGQVLMIINSDHDDQSSKHNLTNYCYNYLLNLYVCFKIIIINYSHPMTVMKHESCFHGSCYERVPIQFLPIHSKV